MSFISSKNGFIVQRFSLWKVPKWWFGHLDSSHLHGWAGHFSGIVSWVPSVSKTVLLYRDSLWNVPKWCLGPLVSSHLQWVNRTFEVVLIVSRVPLGSIKVLMYRNSLSGISFKMFWASKVVQTPLVACRGKQNILSGIVWWVPSVLKTVLLYKDSLWNVPKWCLGRLDSSHLHGEQDIFSGIVSRVPLSSKTVLYYRESLSAIFLTNFLSLYSPYSSCLLWVCKTFSMG